MTLRPKTKPKLELSYPCDWTYKIIGADEEAMRAAIEEVIPKGNYSIAHSNTSRTGKYRCLNVDMKVYTEESRKAIFQALTKHPAIRVVL